MSLPFAMGFTVPPRIYFLAPLGNGMWLGSSVYHTCLEALKANVTFLLPQEWHVPDGGFPFSLGPE